MSVETGMHALLRAHLFVCKGAIEAVLQLTEDCDVHSRRCSKVGSLHCLLQLLLKLLENCLDGRPVVHLHLILHENHVNLPFDRCQHVMC